MIRGIAFFLAVLAAAPPVLGQTLLQVSVTSGGTTTNIAAGGSLTLTAGNLGQPVPASITIRYTGSATASITGVSVTGTSEMSVASAPTLPFALTPGGSTSFTVQYLPSSGNAVTGQVSVVFTNGSQPSSFQFVLIGMVPNLAFNYFFAPNGFLTDLRANDRITFPATNVGSAATATVTVMNRGTAAGSLQSVTVSGASYKLTSSPAPVQLQPAQQASFDVVFTPSIGAGQGLLTLEFSNGAITFSLAGNGTASDFTASYTLADGNAHPLADGAAISFPSIDINTTTTATIRILNQGTGSGTVTAITLGGSEFRLSGLPLLPATIAAGQSVTFGIVFAPSKTGSFTGSFRINLSGRSISGTLAGSTTAPNLAVSYALADSNSHPFVDGSTINFPAIDIKATSTATFDILNQGAGTGTVTAIVVSGTGFHMSGLPLLPATIPPGQALHFGVVFAPTQTGSFNGTVRIDLNGQSVSGTLAASTTSPGFSVSYTFSDSVVHAFSDAGAITFPPVDIKATTTATIDVLNQGTGPGTVTGVWLAGAGFRLSGVPALPATVARGQAMRLGIVFAPTQAGSFTGSFRIDLSGGTSISGSLAGSTASPSISLSYIDPDTNNVVALLDSSMLSFPKTLISAVSNLTVIATNTGAGTGFINSITLGGSSPSVFQLLNLPTLPVSVPPGQQARFGVRFSPQQPETFSATLAFNLGDQTLTINLQAQGVSPQYTYTRSDPNGATPFAPDETLTIADAAVGQTSTVTISILNAGTSDGQIRAVTVTGQGFSLTELPVIPFTLEPNGSQQFKLNFTPAQPEVIKGRLTIGSDTFTITGTGIGPRLIYTYSNAASGTTVVDGGVVIFTPVAVGNNGGVDFSIQNTGTGAATISSINLSAASTSFTLQNLPVLPLTLEPSATVSFPVNFTPNNTGGLTATLRINNTGFTLSGTGSQPMSLPAYQFQGPAGNQEPAQQTAVGLSLASSYPLSLQGTLTLTFVSEVFTDDPAIQFASGGRTVKFTIPANSTQAMFNGISGMIPIQTGTTAGNIVITPSFAIQGGFDLTPSSPAALILTIPRMGPRLLSGSITAQTLNTFTIALNGYSTTRSLRQLDIQITAKPGENFASTHLTVDVTSASAAWFQSTGSQGFGGTFLISIPFVLQNGGTSDELVHRLQSVSITATNETGTSAAVAIPVP